MRFAEGVGAGGGGRRTPAGGTRSGRSCRFEPSGGMRLQVSGSRSYAGKRSLLSDKKKKVDIIAVYLYN